MDQRSDVKPKAKKK